MRDSRKINFAKDEPQTLAKIRLSTPTNTTKKKKREKGTTKYHAQKHKPHSTQTLSDQPHYIILLTTHQKSSFNSGTVAEEGMITDRTGLKYQTKYAN